jgi:hypothetical protein
MGKAARLKRERRARGTADIEVVCPGMLEILSVGKGDIKLTIDGSNEGEVNDARTIIEEMLAKGYGIFVETDKGLTRVKKFNPKRMTYVISEVVENAEEKPLGKRTREKHVPVAGTKAKAIGRTAGG